MKLKPLIKLKMTKEIQKDTDENIPMDLINDKSIENEFESSDEKYLLSKDNNISLKAYETTREFTKRVILVLREHEKLISFPKILIAGKESFDIYWKTEKFKILINIHENRNGLIHIYGKDFTRSNNPIDTKVNFDLSIVYIINWLLMIL